MLPLTPEAISGLCYESFLDGADFVASLDLPRDDDDYGGAVGLMASLSPAGLKSYSFIIGGDSEEWGVPMEKFQSLPNYNEGWNGQQMVFCFQPEKFLFMADCPHSQWKKMTELGCVSFPAEVSDWGDFDLSSVLVRVTFVRKGYGNYALVLQAILLMEDVDLSAFTKNKKWLNTAQCQPVCLFQTSTKVFEGVAEQIECMPLIQLEADTTVGPALSDGALRFICLRAMLDSSAFSHSQSFADWIQYYKKSRHEKPAMSYDSGEYSPLFPVSTFAFRAGAEEMTVVIGGQSYVISKDNTVNVKYVDPPNTVDISGTSEPEPAHKRLRMDSSLPAPVSSDVAGSTGSFTQPPPGSASSGKRIRSFCRLPVSKKVDKLPQPTGRHKYGVNVTLASQFMDSLPPVFASKLTAAWGHEQQKRMQSARTLFCNILKRDPFLHPRKFDGIYIFDVLLGQNKSAQTMRGYLNYFIKWCDIMHVPMTHERLIRTAIKGHENLALRPVSQAAKPFSMPWSFCSMKLLAGGLQAMVSSDTRRAAVWSCALLLFWGLLRTGEVLPTSGRVFDVTKQLCLSDLRFNEDGSVQLWLKLPKVQKERGDVVEIPKLESLLPFCPVRALHNYLRFRKLLTLERDLPLFLIDRGAALSKEMFHSLWKKALRASKVPEYTIVCHRSHGFRSSLPSLLQTADMSPDAIKILGRWQSDAYLTYLRDNVARSKARAQAVLFCEQLGQAFL